MKGMIQQFEFSVQKVNESKDTNNFIYHIVSRFVAFNKLKEYLLNFSVNRLFIICHDVIFWHVTQKVSKELSSIVFF